MPTKKKMKPAPGRPLALTAFRTVPNDAEKMLLTQNQLLKNNPTDGHVRIVAHPMSGYCERKNRADESGVLNTHTNSCPKSARLSDGAGCSRLVSTWFGWSNNQKYSKSKNKCFLTRTKPREIKRNKEN